MTQAGTGEPGVLAHLLFFDVMARGGVEPPLLETLGPQLGPVKLIADVLVVDVLPVPTDPLWEMPGGAKVTVPDTLHEIGGDGLTVLPANAGTRADGADGHHAHRNRGGCRNNKQLADHMDAPWFPPCTHGLEVRRRSPPDMCPTTVPKIPLTSGN